MRTDRLRALAATAALCLLAACGNPYGEPEQFTIPEGSGLTAVADTLHAHEIVSWPGAFRLYARVRGSAGAIKPGVYRMQRGTPWDEVLRKLVAGEVVTVRITIPEGWTAAQIATRIADSTQVALDSVRALVFDSSAAERYDVPGPTLEGYLYPATYIFPAGTRPEKVISTLVERYKRVWTPALRARADSLGMSEKEVVTLASIVEREAKVWEERPTIAAVYHNRIRIGMPLQADPTVQYALGEQQARLLYKHIDSVRESPYNTYTHSGLPPGPIASPSAGAIEATLNPAAVDYLFFVASPDGRHTFTRSLGEHNTAKRAAQRARDTLKGR